MTEEPTEPEVADPFAVGTRVEVHEVPGGYVVIPMSPAAADVPEELPEPVVPQVDTDDEEDED